MLTTWCPETAMVLAAGLGQRMRPLTNTRPKPLVEFRGKPLIDHVLDRLADAGITNAVVNVHCFADQLEAHLKSRLRTLPNIQLSDERATLLDTGGGTTKALPALGDKPFLIHNSDSVWHETAGNNLKRLFAAWDPERMDSLLLLATPSKSLGYDGQGDFVMAEDGLLTRRQASHDVTSAFAFTGVSIAHPRLFEDAPTGTFSLNVLWDRAIGKAKLYGLNLEGTWMHIGTPDALDAAERWSENERAI